MFSTINLPYSMDYYGVVLFSLSNISTINNKIKFIKNKTNFEKILNRMRNANDINLELLKNSFVELSKNNELEWDKSDDVVNMLTICIDKIKKNIKSHFMNTFEYNIKCSKCKNNQTNNYKAVLLELNILNKKSINKEINTNNIFTSDILCNECNNITQHKNKIKLINTKNNIIFTLNRIVYNDNLEKYEFSNKLYKFPENNFNICNNTYNLTGIVNYNIIDKNCAYYSCLIKKNNDWYEISFYKGICNINKIIDFKSKLNYSFKNSVILFYDKNE